MLASEIMIRHKKCKNHSKSVGLNNKEIEMTISAKNIIHLLCLMVFSLAAVTAMADDPAARPIELEKLITEAIANNANKFLPYLQQ